MCKRHKNSAHLTSQQLYKTIQNRIEWSGVEWREKVERIEGKLTCLGQGLEHRKCSGEANYKPVGIYQKELKTNLGVAVSFRTQNQTRFSGTHL